MRSTVTACLLLSLVAPEHVFPQQLTLFPFLSYDSFRFSGFSSGFDYGAGAGYRLTPRMTISAAVALGARTQGFDVIGGTQTLSARLVTLAGALEYRILGDGSGPQLAVSAGGGRVSFAVDPVQVSLGALGTLTVPGRSLARAFAQCGVTGELPLTRSVALFILPSVRIPATGGSGSDYMLEGGARVGIF